VALVRKDKALRNGTRALVEGRVDMAKQGIPE